MNDVEIGELITYTHLLWPGQRDVDRREQITAWRSQLADVEQAAARAAVDEYAATGQPFAPPVGLIRQRAILLTDASGAPSPDEAWEEIGRKISTIGYESTTLDFCWRRDCRGRDCQHRTVTFSHPAIAAVVDAMGWRELCLSSETMADRAHFLRLYNAAVERLTRDATKPPSVAALEQSRPAIEGPSRETDRALPSGAMIEGEERDDEVGLSALRQVRDTLAQARRFD